MQKVPQKSTPVKPITKRTALSLVLSGYRIVYKGRLIEGRVSHVNGKAVRRV